MSASSGSSSESSSPAPTRKKRQIEVDSFDGSDEGDSDPPRPSPAEEVTVLSHAERRRQKKREKQNELATKTPSDAPRKKRKLDDGTSTSKTKTRATPATDDDHRRSSRQNSVWVGNLSFQTTQDALRGFFDGVGTITRVHMPMRRGTSNENMGFAYVDFDTPAAKGVAITLSEGQLDGRHLLIKDGDDFSGRPAKAKIEPFEGGGDGAGGDEGEGEKGVRGATTAGGNSLSRTVQKILRLQKQPPAPTLFLGNLGFETTEASIRELFEAHRYGHKDRGKGVSQGGDGDAARSKDVWIRKIRMGTFEDSGNCKGFAFVDFTNIEHATEALLNPRNHRLNGRDLVVEYASPDAVRRGGGGPRHPKGDQGQKTNTGDGKAARTGFASVPRSKQHRPRHTEQEDDSEVADVPTEATSAPSWRPDHAGRNWSHARRAKPGAALAHAQRQSAAIVPGQGQKIVF